MTAAITAGSTYQTRGVVRVLSRRKRMHSDDKLVWFYKVGALALTLAAIAFQVGALVSAVEPADSTSPETTSSAAPVP